MKCDLRSPIYNLRGTACDKKSFTLIEVIVVIGILAVVTGFAFVGLSAFKNRHNFDLDSENIVNALQNAQSKSVQQEGGNAWGVQFINSRSTDTYSIFRGTSYSTSSIVTSEQLSSASVYSDPINNASSSVVFSERTGKPASGNAIVIALEQAGGNGLYTISVSSAGRISKNLENGLIGYWPFDEGSGGTAYDASGYGHNGIITMGPSGSQTMAIQAWANGNPGRVGTSLNFDGTDDYVSLSNLPINTSAGAQNTVAFWMYLNPTSGGVMPISFSATDLFYYTSYGGFGFNTYNDDIYGVSSNGIAGQWIHIVAVFKNGTPSADQLYINGVAQTLSLIHGTQVNASLSTNMWISKSNGIGYEMPGKIDDVRIYNRALSATEVQNLYNSY